ncbi:PREDICTED: uncharacterized protein LOC105973165 [Erythranthe guttata]|uniref:uncharacterized protein LOC105973165 n=1 Tax=Erythranthe guttata TaxID=4155 RepID=UPI00064D7849|nr:PREDICTED: uncharacterized protein LOC105973165 [Erythranthe guttata]|eukprot:XP_012853639.1 PREDICTED: uncharacterized protein LOC105973165 [Erythranthe guttata]
MVMMIAGSNDGEKRRMRPYVIVGCEHGGLYACRKVPGEDGQRPGKRSTSSKKCNCPFKLKGTKEGKEDEIVEWELTIHSGIHNHNLFGNLQVHSYARRLSKKETSLVQTLRKAMINFNELSGISQLKLLFAKLKEDECLSYHKSNELNEITDLMWIHPKCIKLAQSYPYIFVMECTYKTNRYGLPFLEIMGFTCTNLAFSIVLHTWVTKRRKISNGRRVVWWRP